jgi:hypothetical protein
VTRFENGTILEEVSLGDSGSTGQLHWESSVDMEKKLSKHKAKEAMKRARMRCPVRLGIDIPTEEGYMNLSENEKDILLMSQREYNLFRASQGAQKRDKPWGQAQASPKEQESSVSA